MATTLHAHAATGQGSSKIIDIPGPLFPAGWHFYHNSRQVGQWLTRTPLGFRLLFWCCGQPWFQQQFQDDITLLKRFLAETHYTKATPAQVIQRTLAGHIWRAWWHERLQDCSQATFERQVVISGLEQLQTLYARGQGVLLISYHSIFAPLIAPFLHLYGFPNHTIIGATSAVLPAKGEKITPETMLIEHSRQLMAAKKLLREGGIAFMLPDGLRGRGGQPIPFYHRQRPFRPAFAELALMGETEVVPITFALAGNGQFQLNILAPFDRAPAAGNMATRSKHLTDQYISFLDQQWEKPWELYLRHLPKHLELPPVVTGN